MGLNIYAALVAGLVPMIIGFIWYNEKVFGKKWMRVAEMTDEKMQGANMALIFGLSYVFSVLLAVGLFFIVVHQAHIMSILVNEPGISDPNSDISQWYTDFMDKHGNNFRTFKHGLFHGAIGGILFALPILGVNALFERKGFTYIAINLGFWIICMMLMGGIMSGWV
jgi:hypothetical protein